MRSTTATLATLAALTVPVAAQPLFDLTYETNTPLNVSAQQESSAQSWPVVPLGIGFQMPSPFTRGVSASASGVTCQAGIEWHLDADNTTGSLRYRDRTSAEVTASSSPSIAECGDHAVGLWIRPRGGRPLIGQLLITHTTLSGSTLGTTCNADVDIGDDGSNEYVAGFPTGITPVFRNLVVPASGLKIKIRTHLRSSPPAQGIVGYRRELTVEYRASGYVCDFTEYGVGCGPTLSGREQYTPQGRRHLYFEVANAPISAPGILIFGLSRISVPLPGGCPVLTPPTAIVAMPSDPSGQSSLNFQIRRRFVGSVNAQYVGWNGTALLTSNGLEADCVRVQ